MNWVCCGKSVCSAAASQCLLSCCLQAGSPLPALPKGAAITLTTNLDLQQANPVHYKSTDETAKFEQVGCSPWGCLGCVMQGWVSRCAEAESPDSTGRVAML